MENLPWIEQKLRSQKIDELHTSGRKRSKLLTGERGLGKRMSRG
jgi:hypothetical protein